MAHSLLASVFLVFATSTAFGQVDSEALLAGPGRPRIEAVMTLMEQAKTDPQSQAFLKRIENSSDPSVTEAIQKSMPAAIAAFEWSYPGATYLALGRDAAFVGDVVDAFYLGLSQHRVERIDASGATIKDVSADRLVEFLKNETQLDLTKLASSPGWVIVDQTFWKDQSQSRVLARALFEECVKLPSQCLPEEFASKIGVINTGAARTDSTMYQTNVMSKDERWSKSSVNTSAALKAFFRDQIQFAKEGVAPPEALSVAIDQSLIYTPAFHDSFSVLSLSHEANAKPGALSREETRLKVLAAMVDAIKLTQSEDFIRAVEGSAEDLGYRFSRQATTVPTEAANIRGFDARSLVNLRTPEHDFGRQVKLLANAKRNEGTVSEIIDRMRNHLELAARRGSGATAEHFIQILNPGLANPTALYLEEIDHLWKRPQTIRQFLDLNPTKDELNVVKKSLRTAESATRLCREAADRAKTAEDFLNALAPGVSNPSPAFLANLSDEWSRAMTIDSFLALRPTPEQMSQAKAAVIEVDGLMRMNRAFAKRARTAAEFLRALSPEVKNPSSAYRTALSDDWSRAWTIDSFLALRPTPDEMAEAKGAVIEVDGLMRMNRAFAKRARTAAEFLRALSPEVKNPSSVYLNSIAEEWDKLTTTKTFLALKPSKSEIENVLATSRLFPETQERLRSSLASMKPEIIDSNASIGETKIEDVKKSFSLRRCVLSIKSKIGS